MIEGRIAGQFYIGFRYKQAFVINLISSVGFFKYFSGAVKGGGKNCPLGEPPLVSAQLSYTSKYPSLA